MNIWQKMKAPFSGESAGLHKTIAVVAVITLLLAIPVTLTLVQSQQDIRQEAAQRKRNNNNNNNNYRQSNYGSNSAKESNYARGPQERIVPTAAPPGGTQASYTYITINPGQPTPPGAVCSGRTCRLPSPTKIPPGGAVSAYVDIVIPPGQPLPPGAICTRSQPPTCQVTPTPISVSPDLIPTLSCNHAGSNPNTCIKPWLTPPPGYWDAPGGGTYCDKPGVNQDTCVSRLTPTPDYSSCDNYGVNQANCVNHTPTPGGGAESGYGGGGGGGGSTNPICRFFPAFPGCNITPTITPGTGNPTTTPSVGPGTLVPTSPASGNGSTRNFALDLVLHGIGSGGDVVNVGGGNPNPQTVERAVQMQFFDAQNRPAGTATGVLTYDNTSGTYKGIVSLPLPAGAYTALITTDNYIQSTPRGIIQVQ